MIINPPFIQASPNGIELRMIKTADKHPAFKPEEIKKYYNSLTPEEKKELAKSMYLGEIINIPPHLHAFNEDLTVKDIVKYLKSPDRRPLSFRNVQIQLIDLLKKDGYEVQLKR